MKAYMVEITTHAVVMADDEAHAYDVAENYKRDAFHDDPNPRIEIWGEVVRVDQLEHGWDGECIPYGGDGNTRLGALLTANAPVQRRRAAPSAATGCYASQMRTSPTTWRL